MDKNRNTARRFAVMISGLVIMGIGVAFFKLSLMGNDPHTAMVMAIGEKAGIDFSVILILVNCLWFVFEFLFGRKYIGVGTFANWFGVGIVASRCIDWINAHFYVSVDILPRIGMMVFGILLLSLAASLYQTANMGIAPYDVISILLSDKFSAPYFWCRIFTDSFCTIVTLILGGILGPGTLICAVGLGAFILFFNRHVSEKLCNNQKHRIR